MNQQLLQSNQQLHSSNASLHTQLANVQYQLQQLTKLLRGFKSERFVPAAVSEQQTDLGLIFEQATAATQLSEAQKITYTKVKQASAERQPATALPADLPRVVTTIEPAQDVSGYEKVGEEIFETLDWKPGQLFVNRIVLPQYRNPSMSRAGA